MGRGSGSEAEAVFDFGIIKMEGAAEDACGHAVGCNFQQMVEPVRLDRNPVVMDRVNPRSACQELDKKRFGLHRIIGVVSVHMFVVFGKYGVVDGEFCEHGWLLVSSGNQAHAVRQANRDNPPSLRIAGRRTIPAMSKKNPTLPESPRIHIDREDRARTNSGKTVNSKVRSEGRTLAARERAAITARAFHADEAKSESK